jgi:hypothetical protein
MPGPARLVMAAVLLFIAAAVGVQLLRAEFDPRQAPLSHYLSGPYSAWLRAAYFTLATALVLLAGSLWRTLVPAARSGLACGLLACGGLALVATATWPGSSPGFPADALGEMLHGIAASAAFLLTGSAMVLQSSRLHRDRRWQAAATPLLVLAVAAFAALWLHTLWRALPRGASQKAVVLLYLAWLDAVAWRLRSQEPH